MLSSQDLIAGLSALAHHAADVKRTFRQALGDRFLLEREQIKGWKSYEKARRATKVQTRTMQRVEGARNFTWDSLEDYASGLGVDLEELIEEVIRARRTGRVIDPRALVVSRAFREGDDGDKASLFALASSIDQRIRSRAGSSEESSSLDGERRDAQESTRGNPGRTQKSRTQR